MPLIRGDKMLPKFEELVKNVVSERKRLGLSQKDLAEMADVSKSLVGKLETKANIPNYDNVWKIQRALERARKGKGKTADDFVQRNIISVEPTDSIDKVAKIMKENDFSQLPVKKDGDYIGMITSTQLIDIKFRGGSVADIEYRNLPRIPHDTPKDDFSRLLRSNPAVLVTRGTEVIGMITAADLL